VSVRGAGFCDDAVVQVCVAGVSSGRHVVTVGASDVPARSLRETGRMKLPSLLEAM
jgi:hypothetical protein